MMPESDEEYERRNRDKFVRERDYSDRTRGRDFNSDRFRRDYSNGAGLKRSNNRKDEEPPVVKRNRFDSASDSFEPQFIRKEDSNSSVLLTFKKFLNTQDESITDEEAIAKYLEYKTEFEKHECEKYFQEHKNEEWFRHKYHPEESISFKEIKENFVKKRHQIFNEMDEKGVIAQIALNYLNTEEIIRFMDTVVIKLENGSDEAIDELKDEELDDEAVIEVTKIKAKLEEKKKTTEANNGDGTVNVNQNDASSATIENGKNEMDSINVKENKKILSLDHVKKKKLHKTCSIFFKSISATAKLEELENICKQHPGFLRIALTDPLPDLKSYRHGWVTYRRDVNIKEIFWALKNAKINGVDLGAVVNKDLKRRIRQVCGITHHRIVVQNDIRQVAKLIAIYDHKTKLFIDENNQQVPNDLEKAIMESKNPILNGIVDYLVEEVDAEEEALLSLNGLSNDALKVPVEIDNELISVLDKLLLYLRIVHSVDYYNCVEYLNEDNMPNRVGLFHVRGLIPSKDDSFVSIENNKTMVSKNYIENFISTFNKRLSSTLLKNAVISEEELEKLGKKDAEKAIEEFTNANCVELSKEKWLCPLSGKKFKGPEFILKHLQSKHSDKLNEVRDEVLYFNNYLSDPQRPRNSEPLKSPVNVATPVNSIPQHNNFSNEFEKRSNEYGYRGNSWNNGMSRYANSANRGFGSNRDFNNRSRYFDPSAGNNLDNARKDPRQQIPYRDLDAPDEIW